MMLTPKLDWLAWRPVWAASGAIMDSTVHKFARVVERTLPVLFLAVSLDEREDGVWETFTRISEEAEQEFQAEAVWDAVKEDWWKVAAMDNE